MKQKTDQVHFKLPRAVKTAGLTVISAFIVGILSFSAAAQTPGNGGSFSFGGVYPACTRLCPNCCPTPNIILKEAFRGSGGLNEWYTETFWPLIEQKIISITNQINAGVQNETAKRGALLDGQNHIRAMTSLQKGSAKAANNYTNSEALCRFATVSQTLGASDANSNALRLAMSKRAIDRQLLITNTSGAENTVGDGEGKGATRGQSADKNARWKQYLKVFCDPSDFGQGKAPNGVCETTSDLQYNSDINYPRSIGQVLTLDIGVNAADATKDAVNIEALSRNLYAHDLVNNVPADIFDPKSDRNANESQKAARLLSAIAKRAVAQNTFSSIAAMKAKGSLGNAKYVQNLMIELGVSKKEAEELITDNPSYYALMDALTRRMYQSPSFYVNLMEGKVNVKRQQAAMKSFELMQQRDMYQSIKRSEMLMSTLLELQLASGQAGINKNLGQSQGGDK